MSMQKDKTEYIAWRGDWICQQQLYLLQLFRLLLGSQRELPPHESRQEL